MTTKSPSTDGETADPPPPSGQEPLLAARTRIKTFRFSGQGLLLLSVVVVCVFFSFFTDSAGRFDTVDNFQLVLTDRSVLAIAAIAFTLVLATGHFDLSIGAILTVSSIVTVAAHTRFDVPIVLACLLAVAVGSAIGLVNGVLVALLNVNSLVATLGTTTILAGVISWYTEGRTVIGTLPEEFSQLRNWPWPFVLMLAVGIGIWLLLDHLPFGRQLHAIGTNATAARLVGIHVARSTLISFVASGAICAVAGILLVSRAGAANPAVQTTFLLPSFAAAFLGAAFHRSTFNVPGTVLGVLLAGFSVSGFVLAGAATWVDEVFTGTSLIVAVVAVELFDRRQRRDS